MTTEQIQLVKKTWKAFRGINPETVGDLFYSKLFADNPSLRKMFPADMQQQYKKLMDMLHAVIIRLQIWRNGMCNMAYGRHIIN
jgi:nitric oxide dioxygenase